MKTKNKLELTWIGKNERKKIEPRILVEDKEKSYGDINSGNMLIHGDNLLALKSLEQDYSGKIKCIYIDPPYNTGSAFEHYDDNLEHSIWLSLMRERLILLRELLKDDGTIWIQIDDMEMAYLKVLCDEIFGRTNFINTISIQVSPPNGVKMQHAQSKILKEKEYILIYSKNRNSVIFNPEYIKVNSWDYHYNKYIVGNLENISSCEVVSMKDILEQEKIVPDINNSKFNEWVYKNKDRIFQPVGQNKIKNIEKYNTEKIVPINELPGYFAYKGRQVQFISNSIKDTPEGKVLARMVCDLWTDIGFNNLFQEGNGEFKAGKKPEKLLRRIINMSTNKNDIVLDSFLGSGSTIAVAHKMNRRWIGIEMGEHIYTHCIPRINDVIDNKDKNGITYIENWKGGGGYKFYELAPSLLNKDKYDNWVISDEYDADMLAEAMAKHNGFKFIKEQDVFYKQGYSTEKDFIFTTTSYVNLEYLDMIHELMGNDESLLICCKAYDEECEYKYNNISMQKIPQSILKKYEFGDVNYTLNIEDEIIDDSEDDIDE